MDTNPDYMNSQPGGNTLAPDANRFRKSNITYKKTGLNNTARQDYASHDRVMGVSGPLNYYDNPGKNGFGGRFSRKFAKRAPGPMCSEGDFMAKSGNFGGGEQTFYQPEPRAMSMGKMGRLPVSKTHDNFFSKEGKRHITKGGFPLVSTYQAYFSTGPGVRRTRNVPVTNDGKTIIYKNFDPVGGAKKENYYYEERMIDRDPFNENNFPPEVSRRFNPRYFPRVPFDHIPKMYRWSILGAYTPKNGKTFHKTQVFNNYKPYLVNEFADYGELMD